MEAIVYVFLCNRMEAFAYLFSESFRKGKYREPGRGCKRLLYFLSPASFWRALEVVWRMGLITQEGQ